MPQIPPPERNGNAEEDKETFTTDSPIARFRTLTKRILNVNRSEIKDAEKAYEACKLKQK